MQARFYTLTEVAEMSKRSSRSIGRDLKSGKLQAHKVGGSWRVSEEALAAYINGGASLPMSFSDLMQKVICVRSQLTDTERLSLMSALAEDSSELRLVIQSL